MSEKEKISLSEVHEQVVPQVYQVPIQTIDLPSKGLVYPVESSLHDKPTIDIRSMTARDEDVLTSRALLKQGKTMSVLLKNCITDKTVDPDKMLIGDRNAILVAIRASGYGAQYETKAQCPECSAVFDHTFNLGKFPVIPLGTEPVQPGVNQFLFELPQTKAKVMFRLSTGEDEREISVALERLAKINQGAVQPEVTTRLFQQVISINGESDRAKLKKLVENLPAGDSRALRNYIDKISPGINMVQEVECKECGVQSEVDMPLAANFFWPGTGK